MSSLLGSVMSDAIAPVAGEEPRSIEIITAEIQMLKVQVVSGYIGIGQRLLEAKAQLDHGEWLPWLEQRVQFSKEQAQRFMRLAKEYPNTSPVTHLGMRKALALLAFSPEEREEFIAEPHLVDGEEKSAAEMSVRELEQAIRERKEALLAKEEAEAEARSARESADKAAEEMRFANERIAALSEEVDANEAQLQALRQEMDELRAQPIDVVGAAVPDEAALSAARDEGAAAARKEAKREAEETLKAKIEKAEKAKADAEARMQTIKAAQEATEAKAAELEKRLRVVGNPAATEFQLLFNDATALLKRLSDCLDRILANDADLHHKLSLALIALGDNTRDAGETHLEREGDAK